MADLNLQKVDLSSIKASAHDSVTLQVIVDRDHGYCLKSLPAPLKAFQGLQQLARFASLTQETRNSAIARTKLLDKIRIIPVTSSNIAAIGYSDFYRILQVDLLNWQALLPTIV